MLFCAKFAQNKGKTLCSLLVFTQLFRTRNKERSIFAQLTQVSRSCTCAYLKKGPRYAPVNDLADELATNNNPKPFWSFVKSMRKGSNNLVSLNVDGVTLSNDLSIVESMNDFFSSVFTKEDCDNFPEFEYVTNSKLSNILCNTQEVEKMLKNLNIYKSPGPDSLPPRILKECARVFCHHLCVFSLTTLFQQANCHISGNSLTSHLCSKKAIRPTGITIARSH